MKKHANLSVFVPHAGCRQMCSFCDQRTISQTQSVPKPAEVTALCNKFLPQNGENTEIAFFGGSFTAIEESVRVGLLQAAYEFVRNNRAAGIRLSTRPDAITPEILEQLKQYGVTAIELGAQSMNDEILRLNMRGHTAKQVETAAQLIKQHGFSLGLQMMPGLYGVQNYGAEARETLSALLALKPDTMRIYPAIVLCGTALATFFEKGEYIPLTVEDAVKITAPLILQCENAGVLVIRAGLAADTQLESCVLSGPYHPAFRELCESEIYRESIESALYKQPKGEYEILVKKGALSAAKGHKKQNENIFLQNGYTVKFAEHDTLQNRNFSILRK